MAHPYADEVTFLAELDYQLELQDRDSDTIREAQRDVQAGILESDVAQIIIFQA